MEVLDINRDGILDVYISQADETKGYCGAKRSGVNKYYPNKGMFPWVDWTPPVDEARDILLVGRKGKKLSFRKVMMNFKGRGCGNWVKKFGNDDQTLLVPKGRVIHAGYTYLLQWNKNGISVEQNNVDARSMPKPTNVGTGYPAESPALNFTLSPATSNFPAEVLTDVPTDVGNYLV